GSNGCDSIHEIQLSFYPSIKLDSLQVIDVSVCGLADGEIKLFASGGSAGLNYSINGGQSFVSGNHFTNLPSGNYSIIITDGLCTLNGGTIQISAPNQPLAPQISNDTVYCEGDSISPL